MSVSLSATERIDTERLRQQHPIAEVVERYGIELRGSGSALVGRCPFHADAGRPNLVVYPRSARFVCFRCQVRGDAISFVQQIEHLSFRDAAQRLDTDVVSLRPRIAPRRDPYHYGSPIRSHDELRALAAAVELYANALHGNQQALSYLAERGFERDLLVRERVGFAAGDELVPYLARRAVPVSGAKRVGLLSADGRERLAGRIVFPEIRGRTPIWLIGRLLEPADDLPRYIGLPGPKPLLGWDQASRDRRGVCLVEGPLDLLALQHWGVPGLAICGTGISRAAMRLLTRWEHVYAALDADDAGQKGTARLVDALGERVIALALPEGRKDPAELAPLPQGDDLFRSAISQALARRRQFSIGAWPTRSAYL